MKKCSHIICSLIVLFFNACSSDDNITPQNSINSVKTYGGTKNDSGKSITKKLDGGYAVLGFTQSQDFDITNKLDASFDFWVLNFDASDNLLWSKTYGGTNDDRGNAIIQTQDGGFAILGSSQSNDGDATQNEGSLDYWILKLDSLGNILWQNSFGFSGADFGLSLIQTSDSGYLITGELDVTASNGEGNADTQRQQMHAGGDFWAIKLNATGNLEWSRYFGGTFTDTALSVVESTDNNFVIVGLSDSDDVDISNNKGSYDFWVVKIDNLGNLIWEKSFGGTQIDEAKAITTTQEGNFIIAGNTRSDDVDVSQNKGGADVWIININQNGDLIWEKTFGGSSFDTASSISNTLDGGFIISGNSRSADFDLNENKGQNDAWVFKINSEGVLQWQESIGGYNIDFATDAVELNNQSIIIVGETSSDDGNITENKGFSDLLLFKLTL